jgi:PIN domain nuclease of toxin-antitoxin system
LPGRFHDDPADRRLLATARLRNVPFVRRDKRTLDYAEAGHAQAIKC